LVKEEKKTFGDSQGQLASFSLLKLTFISWLNMSVNGTVIMKKGNFKCI